jgi:hypothetical protein
MRRPKGEGDNLLGTILHIDKFGNLITNIPAEMLTKNWERSAGRLLSMRLERGEKVEGPELGGLDIVFRKAYCEAKDGEALCLTGSLGLLEIAIREGSASARLKANVGDGIILTTKD